MYGSGWALRVDSEREWSPGSESEAGTTWWSSPSAPGRGAWKTQPYNRGIWSYTFVNLGEQVPPTLTDQANSRSQHRGFALWQTGSSGLPLGKSERLRSTICSICEGWWQVAGHLGVVTLDTGARRVERLLWVSDFIRGNLFFFRLT